MDIEETKLEEALFKNKLTKLNIDDNVRVDIKVNGKSSLKIKFSYLKRLKNPSNYIEKQINRKFINRIKKSFSRGGTFDENIGLIHYLYKSGLEEEVNYIIRMYDVEEEEGEEEEGENGNLAKYGVNIFQEDEDNNTINLIKI